MLWDMAWNQTGKCRSKHGEAGWSARRGVALAQERTRRELVGGSESAAGRRVSAGLEGRWRDPGGM